MRPRRANTGGVHVAIERLSLHGFRHAEGRRVVHALVAELARLAGATGWAAAPLETEVRGPVHYEPSREPERTGCAAARALWSSLTGPERETS